MFTFYPYPAFLEFAGLDQDVEREVSGDLGSGSEKKPFACFKNLHLPSGMGFPGGASSKEPPFQETWEMRFWSLGQKDPLEEGTATHFSILAWRIAWTEEPGGATVQGVTKSQQDGSNLAHTTRDI